MKAKPRRYDFRNLYAWRDPLLALVDEVRRLRGIWLNSGEGRVK